MKDEITCVTIISQQTLLNALQRKQSTPTRLEGEKHAVITKQIFPAEPQSAEFRAEIRLDREGGEKKKKTQNLHSFVNSQTLKRFSSRALDLVFRRAA